MLLSLFLSARNLAASTLYEINQSINNDQSINRALCRRRLEKFARYTRPSNSHHLFEFLRRVTYRKASIKLRVEQAINIKTKSCPNVTSIIC